MNHKDNGVRTECGLVLPEPNGVAIGRGVFYHCDAEGKPLSAHPNNLTFEGATALLKSLFHAAVATEFPNGLYLGMCAATGLTDIAAIKALTLEDLVEPVGNGYARQQLNFDNTAWPTIDIVGLYGRAWSNVVNFTGAEAQWTVPCLHYFLASVATGTTGTLFAISAPFGTAETPQPVQLDVGEIHPGRYAYFQA